MPPNRRMAKTELRQPPLDSRRAECTQRETRPQWPWRLLVGPAIQPQVRQQSTFLFQPFGSQLFLA
jgi:hypothetical protein